MIDDKIIKVDIRQGDIEHTLPLAEFRDLLVDEIGSVTWLIGKESFRRKINLSVDRVIQRIRDAR